MSVPPQYPAPGAPPGAAQGQLNPPTQPPPSGTISERPHPLSPIVKGWIAIAAVLFFGLRELPIRDLEMLGEIWWLLVAIVGLAFVVPLALGYFSWRFTRFVIDDEQVRIERNFISRRSERIAFTKIQSVDVVQPLVARLFGLAALRIDVGGQGSAKSIEFLSRHRAYQLRDYLISRAHGTHITVAESVQRPVGDVMADRSTADRIIVAVPIGRLTASLVASNGTAITLTLTMLAVTVSALTGNLSLLLSTVLVLRWLIAAVSWLLGRI